MGDKEAHCTHTSAARVHVAGTLVAATDGGAARAACQTSNSKADAGRRMGSRELKLPKLACMSGRSLEASRFEMQRQAGMQDWFTWEAAQEVKHPKPKQLQYRDPPS